MENCAEIGIRVFYAIVGSNLIFRGIKLCKTTDNAGVRTKPCRRGCTESIRCRIDGAHPALASAEAHDCEIRVLELAATTDEGPLSIIAGELTTNNRRTSIGEV